MTGNQRIRRARRAIALAFAAGTVAGAYAHKNYVGPLFAFAAVRQLLAVRAEAAESITRQQAITPDPS